MAKKKSKVVREVLKRVEALMERRPQALIQIWYFEDGHFEILQERVCPIRAVNRTYEPE